MEPALALLTHDHGLRSALWLFSTSPLLTVLHFSLHQFKPNLLYSLLQEFPSSGLKHPWPHNVAHSHTPSVATVSWYCLSRILWASQRGRESAFTHLGTFKALDKHLMEQVPGRAETSYNVDWLTALKDPSSCFPERLSCPHPTPGPSPGKLWDFCLQTASIPACIKASNKGFHNTPTPYRLQSSSRAPCLNKRCGIFLGNDEATSHKRKEKIPQVQKGFLDNKQNSIPARTERKDLTSRLFMLGKGACCAANRRRELQGEKRGRSLWVDVGLSSVQSWRPNLMLHLILPEVPLGAPLSPLSLMCIPHQIWS